VTRWVRRKRINKMNYKEKMNVHRFVVNPVAE
jgi:hypothetical protein